MKNVKTIFRKILDKMAEWSLITKHGQVLSYIAHHPRSTAREIAIALGITERTAQKIISDISDAGYITRRKRGRRNIYRVNPELIMSHPSHGEFAIGDLLRVLGWKKRKKKSEEANLEKEPALVN